MALYSRTLVGGVLGLGVFLVIRYAPLWALTTLAGAWAVLATLEFLGLLRRAGIILNPWLLGALNASVAIAAWLGWMPGYIIAPLGIILLVTILSRLVLPRIPVYGVFVIVYLGLLPAHLVLLGLTADEQGFSRWLVFFPLVLTWTNDTAAYAIGRLFGRFKLMPALSPRKTWEGFIAGLIASAVMCALWLGHHEPFADRSWGWLALVGIGLGTIAQIGDLFESLFKRAVSVKDSSTALSGHGGFLDRIDSLLFVIPAFYWLMRLSL